jgi:hypothetical protein
MKLTEIARQEELNRARMQQRQQQQVEAERAFRDSLQRLNENVQRVVTATLPGVWRLDSLQIGESGRISSPDEARVSQRFACTVVLTTDTYLPDSESGPITFLTPTLRAGTRREITGTVISTLGTSGWESELTLNGFGPRDGRPQAAYSGRTIVRGSPEEQEYLKAEQDQAENKHQQALLEIRRDQELKAAKLAADAALQRQQEDTAAAESARRQKEIGDRQVAKEKQLASLSQAFSSGDIGKRRAAISAALASGDEDQVSAALKETLVQKDVVGGVFDVGQTLGFGPDAERKKVAVGFSVRITGFNAKTGNFRVAITSPPFACGLDQESPGSGSLDGLTVAMSTGCGTSFQGRFDGRSKFVGSVVVQTFQTGNFQYSGGTYPAAVSIF